MARMVADTGVLDPEVVMILLAVASKPLHGYGIMRDVERRSDGAMLLQTGALYRTLKWLLQDGLIAECAAPRDADSGDLRRRYYRATALGASTLAAEVERMARIVRMARPIGRHRRPSPA